MQKSFDRDEPINYNKSDLEATSPVWVTGLSIIKAIIAKNVTTEFSKVLVDGSD